ncbi:MAG: ParB/RepB/Spo0J family partition protein [Faecalibacterium prausnitzii]|jgi:ParB family chromosome partitioning protein|nr:ParB/RepB/Spo0J family partition protein [Faecalibacterium prausnitzii]
MTLRMVPEKRGDVIEKEHQQPEQIQQIPVNELFPFKNHPFKVLDDDAMTRTVESISQFGVLAPLIARPRPEGGYEIISGHRRKHAAELAHLDTVPVIVRNMEDDAATILKLGNRLLVLSVPNEPPAEKPRTKPPAEHDR